MKFLIIDGSYYNFFRYYAIVQWFKLAKSDQELGIPIENAEFVDKFRSTFVEKIAEFQKKLKWQTCVKIVTKDCPRKDIWRNDIFNKYKQSRDKDTGFMGGPLFKLAYKELYDAAGINAIVSYPRLEADDCAALTAKRIIETVPNAEIVIITSDMDYLQLASDKIKLINLKYQDLSKSKNATGNPLLDKFCKIVCGDKSDDIPGIFKKCGMKTAIKMYNDKSLFEKKLEDEEGSKEKFILNQKLVDFDFIPQELVSGFRREVLGVCE
jgi:5'-3' exonuclease